MIIDENYDKIGLADKKQTAWVFLEYFLIDLA